MSEYFDLNQMSIDVAAHIFAAMDMICHPDDCRFCTEEDFLNLTVKDLLGFLEALQD